MLICPVIAFFSAAGIYFIIQCIKRALLREIHVSDKLRVDTLVSVCGEASELEMLLKKLESQNRTGKIYLRICNADAKVLQIAEKLAQSNHIEIIN